MLEFFNKQEELEFIKCANDFPYFSKKYIKIIDPKKGLIPLELFDYQKRLGCHYDNHRFSIVKAFRQAGYTTFTAAYMLHKCLFKTDQNIMFICRTDRDARHVGGIVQLMIRELPQWLTPRLSICNQHEKVFKDTGSKLMFHTAEAARSRALTYAIIDQAAFIRNIDSHWKAIYPTFSTGGKCIIISCPNGKNWFYKMYDNARKGENQLTIFDAAYTERPDFNADWEKEIKPNFNERGWQQEYLGIFLE